MIDGLTKRPGSRNVHNGKSILKALTKLKYVADGVQDNSKIVDEMLFEKMDEFKEKEE